MGLRTALRLKRRKEPSRAIPAFINFSHSQLGQDLWVLSETGLKRGGFFVEIGAFDGVTLSNTYLLEKHFGWSGILAEPNPSMASLIAAQRTAAFSPKCVWHTSGEFVSFAVTEEATLSTMKDFLGEDSHDRSRHEMIAVETISLNDLLAEYNASKMIDFVSIDTEGSEIDILSTFDFNRCVVDLFAVEHNYELELERALDELMTDHGYQRVHKDASQWDGWYRRIVA